MKTKRTSLVLTIGLGVLLAGFPASGQTLYHLGDDFSLSGNPNGQWTYGYSPSLGDPLTLFPYTTTSMWGRPFMSAWYSGIAWDDSPQISKNMSPDPEGFGSVSFLSGQINFHPGPNDEKAIARWTAPAAGTYWFEVTFEGRDWGIGTTTDVHVLVNGVSIFDDSVWGYLETAHYAGDMYFEAGDTLDFAVGNGGNSFTGDSTACDAAVADDPALGQETGSWGDVKALYR